MGKVTNDEDEILWKDRTHHMWFPLSFTKYSISDNRLYVQKGFLKTDYDETLLYRILDIKLSRNLGQKIFGTGDITLFAKADSEGVIVLHNIKKPIETKKLLSKLVEDVRNNKNVVGKEFYGDMHGHSADLDGDGIPDCMQGPDDHVDNVY